MRGINPEYVVFDSWHATLNNLKLIGKIGSHWFREDAHLRDPSGRSPHGVAQSVTGIHRLAVSSIELG